MKKLILLGFAFSLIFGCAALMEEQATPTGPKIAQQVKPKITATEIIAKLNEQFGAAYRYEVNSHIVNGERITIERYFYDGGNANYVVTFINGELQDMVTNRK